MINPNRKVVRNEFGAILVQALEGEGKLAQKVYSCRPGDFGGAFPVVTVSGNGTLREQQTFQGAAIKHQLQVDVFVLYATEDGSWTVEMAEDRLDDIQAKISEVIAANQVTAHWDSIAQSDWSERLDVVIGGADYIREFLILSFE